MTTQPAAENVRSLVRCPYCRRAIDQTELRTDQPPDDELGTPKPDGGDIFICWSCGYPAMYGDDRQLHRPAADELAWILAQPGVRTAIAIFRRRRR